MTLRLSVVVPAYNEGDSIANSVRKIMRCVAQIPHASLVIVNDGSTDNTKKILDDIHTEYSDLKIIHLSKNCGYGQAIVEGYCYASTFSTHVLFMDSDLTNSPSDIVRFRDEIEKGAEFVKATRFEKGGGMVGVPYFRRVHSSLGALIARKLLRLPVTDPTNGFRAIKVGLIDFNLIEGRGFSSIVEEMYLISKLKKVRIKNLPVILTSRLKDQSKTSFTYGYRTYMDYLKPAIKAYLERGVYK